jgi:hypothetical protein
MKTRSLESIYHIQAIDYALLLHSQVSLKLKTCYHSLSISIVPARVESTPMPPQILIITTRNKKTGKFANFKDE